MSVIRPHATADIVPAKVIAERYAVTERSVLAWAKRGVIPCLRIGHKTLRFRLSAVIETIEGSGGAK